MNSFSSLLKPQKQKQKQKTQSLIAQMGPIPKSLPTPKKTQFPDQTHNQNIYLIPQHPTDLPWPRSTPHSQVLFSLSLSLSLYFSLFRSLSLSLPNLPLPTSRSPPYGAKKIVKTSLPLSEEEKNKPSSNSLTLSPLVPLFVPLSQSLLLLPLLSRLLLLLFLLIWQMVVFQ